MTKKLVPFLLPEGGWHTYWAVGNKQGYCGIATFTKTEPRAVYTDRELLAEYNEEGYGLSTEGRLVVTDHGEFLLFNVYVPNSGKVMFLSSLAPPIYPLTYSSTKPINQSIGQVPPRVQAPVH